MRLFHVPRAANFSLWELGVVIMWKPCKLTRTNAVKLMRRVIPVPMNLINGGSYATGAVCYKAPVGPEGLEIKVENDWFTRNGCIKLTISDPSGGSCLTMYFSPNTFERDYSAEEFDKKEAAADARKQWVQQVGREQAHKLVDQYWGKW